MQFFTTQVTNHNLIKLSDNPKDNNQINLKPQRYHSEASPRDNFDYKYLADISKSKIKKNKHSRNFQTNIYGIFAVLH